MTSIRDKFKEVISFHVKFEKLPKAVFVINRSAICDKVGTNPKGRNVV